MIHSNLERELHLQLEHLTPQGQQEVLEFARSRVNAPVRPMKKQDLLALAGTLSDEEARQMMADIDEACGQVEPDAW